MQRTFAVALAVLLLVGGVASVATALPVQNAATGLQEETPAADETNDADTDGLSDGEHPKLDRILHAMQERYDLTDAQVDELESLVLRMHDDGASRAEIRRAVADRLVEFGVDEDQLRRDARSLKWGHTLVSRFGLSPAEARDAVGDARRMHADGASREEVREYVRDRVGHHAHDGAHFSWYVDYLDLTDEQVDELKAVAREARADGAYPAEVRAEVIQQLRSYGFTNEELEEAHWAHRLEHLQIRFDLTDDQVAEIDAEVDRLIRADAFRVEIRAAVIGELQEFGVIPDDYPREPQGPRGPMPPDSGAGAPADGR